MAIQFDPRLVSWFDAGLSAGVFRVPDGRHIVLNQYPRLMKESRLRASAAVGHEELLRFLLAINPNFVTVDDGSPAGMSRQLATECDPLPAIRKVYVPVLPNRRHESWFVYTPPLSVMRSAWTEFKMRRGMLLH